MAEMLIQSGNGEIHLLPALPEAWRESKATGLRARVDFTVDMEWNDGKLAIAKIYGACGTKGALRRYCMPFETDEKGEFLIKNGVNFL